MQRGQPSILWIRGQARKEREHGRLHVCAGKSASAGFSHGSPGSSHPITSSGVATENLPDLLQFRRCSDGEQYGFFGVFDGHGGPAAASFVKENLFVKLENDPNFPHDMPAALSAHPNPVTMTRHAYRSTVIKCYILLLTGLSSFCSERLPRDGQ